MTCQNYLQLMWQTLSYRRNVQYDYNVFEDGDPHFAYA